MKSHSLNLNTPFLSSEAAWLRIRQGLDLWILLPAAREQ